MNTGDERVAGEVRELLSLTVPCTEVTKRCYSVVCKTKHKKWANKANDKESNTILTYTVWTLMRNFSCHTSS